MRDKRPRPAIIQLMRHLPLAVARIDSCNRRPRLQYPEKRHLKLHAIRRQNPHHIPLPKPQQPQRRRQPIAIHIQLLIRIPKLPINHRHLIRHTPRRTPQHILQRKRPIRRQRLPRAPSGIRMSAHPNPPDTDPNTPSQSNPIITRPRRFANPQTPINLTPAAI